MSSEVKYTGWIVNLIITALLFTMEFLCFAVHSFVRLNTYKKDNDYLQFRYLNSKASSNIFPLMTQKFQNHHKPFIESIVTLNFQQIKIYIAICQLILDRQGRLIYKNLYLFARASISFKILFQLAFCSTPYHTHDYDSIPKESYKMY